MAIRGIHHVAISTGNFDRILAFYREAFGFAPVGGVFEWRDEPFIDQIIGVPASAARSVMLAAGNIYLEVFEYSNPAPSSTRPLAPNDRGYTHFAIDSDDIAADFNRLKAAGMTFVHTEFGDAGHIKAVYGKDPDGNIVELQQIAENQALSLSRRMLHEAEFGKDAG